MEARAHIYNDYDPMQEFLSMPPEERCELIDGHIVMMAPASMRHNDICEELAFQLNLYLRGKKCKVYHNNAGVELRRNKKRPTVLIPDIVVVCDRSKIKPWGCDGVPDMVIEVSSPSSGRHDSIRKFNLYRTAGVREYWIVRPDEKMITVCLLQNGEYFTRFYDRETSPLSITVLDNCMVDLHLVFPENLRL